MLKNKITWSNEEKKDSNKQPIRQQVFNSINILSNNNNKKHPENKIKDNRLNKNKLSKKDLLKYIRTVGKLAEKCNDANIRNKSFCIQSAIVTIRGDKSINNNLKTITIPVAGANLFINRYYQGLKLGRIDAIKIDNKRRRIPIGVWHIFHLCDALAKPESMICLPRNFGERTTLLDHGLLVFSLSDMLFIMAMRIQRHRSRKNQYNVQSFFDKKLTNNKQSHADQLISLLFLAFGLDVTTIVELSKDLDFNYSDMMYNTYQRMFADKYKQFVQDKTYQRLVEFYQKKMITLDDKFKQKNTAQQHVTSNKKNIIVLNNKFDVSHDDVSNNDTSHANNDTSHALN